MVAIVQVGSGLGFDNMAGRGLGFDSMRGYGLGFASAAFLPSLASTRINHARMLGQTGDGLLDSLKSGLGSLARGAGRFIGRIARDRRITRALSKAGSRLLSTGIGALTQKIADATAPRDATAEQLAEHNAQVNAIAGPIGQAVTATAGNVAEAARETTAELADVLAAENRAARLEAARARIAAAMRGAASSSADAFEAAGIDAGASAIDNATKRYGQIGSALRRIRARPQAGGLLRIESLAAIPTKLTGAQAAMSPAMLAAAQTALKSKDVPAALQARLAKMM